MVNKKSSTHFVNLFILPNIEDVIIDNNIKKMDSLKGIKNGFICKSLLSKKEVDFILNSLKNKKFQPVGKTGYVSEYKEGDEIGSYRGSIFNEYLSYVLFQRIKNSYPKIDNYINNNNIDHDNTSEWTLSGINPLFRFIKYKEAGSLFPHYDAPYIKNKKERTLVTIIIYLTKNESGATRFIKDPQLDISCYDRNLEDWNKIPLKKEILLRIEPNIGNALIFDHRILHDCEKVMNEEKIIIRTDLFFKRK
jgi:hypothetical protein